MGRKKQESKFDLAAKFFRRELDIDIVESYEKLKKFSKLGPEGLRDRFKLSEAIDEAANNAHLANSIYLKAKKEREMFKVEYAKRMHEISRIALARVQIWLEETKSRKQPTKDMIEEEIAAHEDTRKEREDLVVRLEEIREIRDNLKSLAEQWSDRKGLLQTQARLLTAQKEVVLGK